MDLNDLSDISGFEWDEGNEVKNFLKHSVNNTECEEIFENKPLFVNFDKTHSTIYEERFQALGKFSQGRLLFLSFTIRSKKIRVISARDMSAKERKIYNE